MATSADGFQGLLSEITSGETGGLLSFRNLLVLGFLAFLFDFPSDLLGTSVGSLPHLWPPLLSACLGRGSFLCRWSRFLGAAGLTSTPCLTRPGGRGSRLGGQPGVPRMPSPRLSPLDVSGPGMSSGAVEPRTGGEPAVWLGPLSPCFSFSFTGALRLLFPGVQHIWAAGSPGWGAGSTRRVGWEVVPLCSPCFLALWRLKPGLERKVAKQTSQVTGCPLGSWSFQWPFSVDTGLFLKPQGFCLGSWEQRVSSWGIW